MGLFRKKKEKKRGKTPEEKLAEVRALYEQENYSEAIDILSETSWFSESKEFKREINYWFGRCFLAWYEKESDPDEEWKEDGQYNLEVAAEEGHEEAAVLLAEKFGILDYLPKETADQTAPEPILKSEAPALMQKSASEDAPTPVKMPELEEVPAPADAPEPEEISAPAEEPEPEEVEPLTEELVSAEEPYLGVEEGDEEEIRYLLREGYMEYKNKSFPFALSAFKTAARLGSAEAQFNCGMMYHDGEGVAADREQALYWFGKAAEQGFAKAQFNYGAMYYENGDDGEMDLEKALYWIGKAAEQDEVEAQYVCGVMHYNGEGTVIDKEKALYWFEKAAGQGHLEARFRINKMYEKNEVEDTDKVLAHYSEGYSFVDDVEEQYMFGIMSDVEGNKKMALFWYTKAAEQGDVKAQLNCAQMYDKGDGIAMDKKKALYWYEKAAEQGNAAGQVNCGLMYDSGEGVAVDKKKALHWYEKAAEQGSALAQFQCGVMYYDGDGTARDKATAKSYFKKVAAQTENKELQDKARKILREYF